MQKYQILDEYGNCQNHGELAQTQTTLDTNWGGMKQQHIEQTTEMHVGCLTIYSMGIRIRALRPKT